MKGISGWMAALLVSSAVAAPKTNANVNAKGEEWLLLQHKMDGDAELFRTLWVKTENGKTQVVGEFPQMLIALNGKLFSVEETPAEYRAYDCEAVFFGPEMTDEAKNKLESSEYSYKRLTLKDVTAKNAAPIWIAKEAPFDPEKGDPTENAGSFDSFGFVAGLAGKYLSLQNCTDLYICGAHNAVFCETVMFDLDKRERIDVKTSPLFTMPNAQQVKSLKWASDEEIDASDAELELCGWRSQYDESGLALSLLVSRGVTFAGSGPEWSSYTTTAFFKQTPLNPAFKPYAALPKCLAPFTKGDHSWIIGYSKIDGGADVMKYLNAHVRPATPDAQPSTPTSPKSAPTP